MSAKSGKFGRTSIPCTMYSMGAPESPSVTDVKGKKDLAVGYQHSHHQTCLPIQNTCKLDKPSLQVYFKLEQKAIG